MYNKIKGITVLLMLVSFKLSAQSENLVNGRYTNNIIGWSINVPKDWQVETANHKPNNSVTSELISFSKGGYTSPMFRSTIEDSVSLASNGVKTLDDFSNGILMVLKKVDPMGKMDVKVSNLKVGSQNFKSIAYTEAGGVGVNRTIGTYRKGYLFTMTWFFEKNEDKAAIEKAVLSSTFK